MHINPRIILLPFMVIFELVLIVVCLILSVVKVDWAIAINDWSKKLPELDWYT